MVGRHCLSGNTRAGLRRENTVLINFRDNGLYRSEMNEVKHCGEKITFEIISLMNDVPYSVFIFERPLVEHTRQRNIQALSMKVQ